MILPHLREVRCEEEHSLRSALRDADCPVARAEVYV
jgi:hypothetical protein